MIREEAQCLLLKAFLKAPWQPWQEARYNYDCISAKPKIVALSIEPKNHIGKQKSKHDKEKKVQKGRALTG